MIAIVSMTPISEDAAAIMIYLVLAFGALIMPVYFFVFCRHTHRPGKMLITVAVHICIIIAIIIYANAVRLWGYRDYQFVWILLYPLNIAMVIGYVVVARKSRRSAQRDSLLDLGKKE